MDSRKLPAVNEAFGLIAPPLTPLQTAPFGLYQRGLNVFPVPKPYEVQAWAAIYRHGALAAKQNTSLSRLGQVVGSKQKPNLACVHIQKGVTV